ncbi:hypothetical protein WN51_08496 [Melipona quadrifasciata]|uniref:Uncharacterized protein n=1 Tax=Melipona quadrifasciata TaxID=166423 RepID=A0A0M9A7E5_9HYME|nr:hypothetical protein WN51_08496 [Melipona quadrifasciata]
MKNNEGNKERYFVKRGKHFMARFNKTTTKIAKASTTNSLNNALRKREMP